MSPEPSTSPEASEAIGKLCIAGDWACANSDLAGLGSIARQLADYAPEPIHCELVTLATICAADPVRAASLWGDLKDRLYREVRV